MKRTTKPRQDSKPVAHHQFEGFDYKAWLREKIKNDFIASLDKAIYGERAKKAAKS